jgi:glutathione S-transferase
MMIIWYYLNNLRAKMGLVEIVMVLALLQYLAFGVLVTRARTRYGIQGSAVSGHEMFVRYYRVQMNTLEMLVVFLPAMWLAAQFWSPLFVSGVGLIYLAGRMVFLRAYVSAPESRGMGFSLSMGPTVVLLLAGLVGALLALVN